MLKDDPVVLLVEDNEDDEALALRGLRQHLPKAQVCVARNGEDAMACLRGTLTIQGKTISAIPTFILLDLKLPFVSGFEVLRSIRDSRETRLVPVVVFSSSNEPADVERSYSLGANTYIQKPLDLADYMRTIKDVARYWFELASISN